MGDLMSNNIFKKNNNIVILDWESFDNKMPVIVDIYGSRDWKFLINEANAEIKNLDSSKLIVNIDIIYFMIITSYELQKIFKLVKKDLTFEISNLIEQISYSGLRYLFWLSIPLIYSNSISFIATLTIVKSFSCINL